MRRFSLAVLSIFLLVSTAYSATTLLFKRGTDAQLQLEATPNAGEPLFTTDTWRFFVGTGTGKQEFAKTTSPTFTGIVTAPSFSGTSYDGTTFSGTTFVSNAQDGYHYTRPYNSVPFAGTPAIGMIQTTDSGVKWYNGTAWADIASGGSSGSNYTSAPAYSNSTGTAGQYAADANYAYICYATNSWIRIAKDSWSTEAPASISISPTSYGFGNIVTGNSSAAQVFTVSNAGGTTGNLGTLALSGANADQFTLASNTCSSTLAAGANCTVSGTFSPTSTGAKTATLGDGTYTASLSGTGVASQASTETLTPTAASGWTNVGGSSLVASVTDTNDSTYGTITYTSSSMSLTVPTPTGGGTIASVQLCARMRSDSGATAPYFKLYNGSVYKPFSPAPIATLTTSFADYCSNVMTQNPYTNATWVASEISALSWRVMSGTSSGTTSAAKVWIVVNYQ